jgi:2-keto-myo-inositol isomerase
MCKEYGIKIISINALQKFNCANLIKEKIAELTDLIKLSSDIECTAIVLCPDNDIRDTRNSDQKYNETVQALQSYRSLFEDSGITGLVEPLGFPESSLRSCITAMKAIRESCGTNYRIVHDTFHHFLGTDTLEDFKREYDMQYTGLIHVSGVEAKIAGNAFRDEHRILLSSADLSESAGQIKWLFDMGASAPVSFEPFAEEIHYMPENQLFLMVKKSMEIIENIY